MTSLRIMGRAYPAIGAAAAVCVACSSPDPDRRPDGDVDWTPIPRVSQPLFGGTAAVADGWLVAADPDADRVHVADLASGAPGEWVDFLEGWAPGAVAMDGPRAVVTLRGPGALAELTLDPPGVERLTAACAEPRGVDVLGPTAAVACAGGELVLVVDGRARRLVVEPDLHDVVLEDGGTALVTRFRAAEVLRVDLADGTVLARWSLPALDTTDGRVLVGRVARRMVRVGDGRVAVLHQAHVTDPVPLDDPGTPAYGSGACEAVARPLVTWLGADGPEATVRLDAVLAVDLAFSPEGDGAFSEPTPLVGAAVVGPWGAGVQSAYPPSALQDPVPYCVPRGSLVATEAVVSGVALGPDGPLAVTRQPFSVVGQTGELVAPVGEADPGFALFHRPSPAGVTCATCHAEGRDDGHTWDFVGMGLRRTQTLAGELVAPFHWDGALENLAALFEDTGVRRMGMAPASADEIAALGAWLDALPAPVSSGEPAADGEEAYEAAGCADCHASTLAFLQDVGTGGRFQAPSLVGVGARLPLMHDGCATTIRERFDPDCGGDAHGPSLDPEEIDRLVDYLGTR